MFRKSDNSKDQSRPNIAPSPSAQRLVEFRAGAPYAFASLTRITCQIKTADLTTVTWRSNKVSYPNSESKCICQIHIGINLHVYMHIVFYTRLCRFVIFFCGPLENAGTQSISKGLRRGPLSPKQVEQESNPLGVWDTKGKGEILTRALLEWKQTPIPQSGRRVAAAHTAVQVTKFRHRFGQPRAAQAPGKPCQG